MKEDQRARTDCEHAGECPRKPSGEYKCHCWYCAATIPPHPPGWSKKTGGLIMYPDKYICHECDYDSTEAPGIGDS